MVLLLSGRPEVQILLATLKTSPKTLIFQGFRRFLFSERNRTGNKWRLAGANSANQQKLNKIFLTSISKLMISYIFGNLANEITIPANQSKKAAKIPANQKGKCFSFNLVF